MPHNPHVTETPLSSPACEENRGLISFTLLNLRALAPQCLETQSFLWNAFQKVVKAAQLYLPTLKCQSWLSLTTPMEWFTIKGDSSGTARQKRFAEQGMRKENRAAMPSLSLPLPWNLQVFTNLEALRTPWNSRLKHLASWVITYLYLLPQILGPYCSQRPWNHLMQEEKNYSNRLKLSNLGVSKLFICLKRALCNRNIVKGT